MQKVLVPLARIRRSLLPKILIRKTFTVPGTLSTAGWHAHFSVDGTILHGLTFRFTHHNFHRGTQKLEF